MDQAQLALHCVDLRQSAFSCKYDLRSLRMAAITTPSGGAIKTQFLLWAGTLPHALGATE